MSEGVLVPDISRGKVPAEVEFFSAIVVLNCPNLPGPGQGCLVPHSIHGLPDPWVPLGYCDQPGDGVVFDSRMVHWGSGRPEVCGGNVAVRCVCGGGIGNVQV